MGGIAIGQTPNRVSLQADKLAAGLLALGLSKGDRVAMWGPNSLEWVLVKLAVARAGLVLVSISAHTYLILSPTNPIGLFNVRYFLSCR